MRRPEQRGEKDEDRKNGKGVFLLYLPLLLCRLSVALTAAVTVTVTVTVTEPDVGAVNDAVA